MTVKRRQTTIIDLLNAPWWLSAVLAVCVYIIFKVVVPMLVFSQPVYTALVKASSHIASPLIFILIIVSVFSALKTFAQRRRSHTIHRVHTDIDSIRALSWDEFERLMAHAFRLEGYQVQENDSKGADNGIDLILKKNTTTRLVQCKHWCSTKVGVSVVRELLGVVVSENADGGILATTGALTKAAGEFAHANNLTILDGDDLVALLQKQLPDFTIHDSASNDESRTPVCPKCHGAMVLRTSKTGKTSGEQFWGCQSFPRCRGTLSL